ncbi:MAG: hypothetical protein R3A52_08845 [Polyangiales bacterium]
MGALLPGDREGLEAGLGLHADAVGNASSALGERPREHDALAIERGEGDARDAAISFCSVCRR